MAKGTTLEHTETGRSSGTAHHDGIHLSLQGKGGVGKSLVASILAQYFRGRGRSIQAGTLFATGAITGIHPIGPGQHCRVEVNGGGSVELRTVDTRTLGPS